MASLYPQHRIFANLLLAATQSLEPYAEIFTKNPLQGVQSQFLLHNNIDVYVNQTLKIQVSRFMQLEPNSLF